MKVITIRDYDKIKEKAKQSIKNIPFSHYRIREEKENEELIKLVTTAKTRANGKPRYLIITESYNQGTRKWSHYIKIVRQVDIEGKNEHETPCTLYGYRKDKILAIVK